MILITGGMGFIGLHTARRFLDMGEDVVVTHYRVRRTPDFIADELGKRLAAETVDVTSPHDMLEVVRRHKVTGIVHLAVPGLGALWPGEEYRVNMMGLINVLEAARQSDVKRVSVASSITVYGGLPAGPYREDAVLPIESRGSTEAYKKSWEILGLLYASQTGTDVAMLRLGGIYGPLYHSMANLPSRLCHAAARGTTPNLAGGRGGVPYAEDEGEFCYVKDCARGIQLLHMAEKLNHRIYNVGGVGGTNQELVDAIKEVVPTFEVSLESGRSARARPSPHMDLTRSKGEVGYSAEYDLRRAAADYIGWLGDHPE